MSLEGFSICSGGSNLISTADLINDHTNLSSNNDSASLDSNSNNQESIESLHSGTNVSICGGNQPIDAPSIKFSSRGRRIKSNTDFLGVTLEYNFRQSSIVNRIKSELSRKAPKQPKPKSKPPPLSKYRRRAANARERGRMQEINEAFENLRSLIPESETVSTEEPSTSRGRSASEDSSSKMTKITTLRQAMDYISALRELLKNDEEETQEVSGVSDGSEYPDTSSACSILGNISPPFSSDEADIFVSDSCSDELGLLDSEGETWRN